MSFFIFLLIVGLLILAWLVVRKLPQLNMIQPHSTPRAKQEKRKKQMYEDRLKRQLSQVSRGASKWIQPLLEATQKLFKVSYQKLRSKEEEYRHKLLHQDFQDSVDKEQKIAALLTDAQESFADKNWNEAESRLIDILKMDPHNIDAYNKLGRLYWEKKDYDHAIEIYEYLAKLSAHPDVYNNLAAIAEERGNLGEAEKNYLSALQLNNQASESHYHLAELYGQQDDWDKAQLEAKAAAKYRANNPKYLDFLLRASIIVQDKKTALDTLQKMQEVNPENKKLAVYQEQIDQLS
ncbi:MAG: tetratricopeptide repeat protein [Candidatus Komeilibacteria bacterium]